MRYISASYPLIHFPYPSAVQKENKQLCSTMKAHPLAVWDFSIHVLTKHEAAEMAAKASWDPAASAWITTSRKLSPARSAYTYIPLIQGEKALTLWSSQYAHLCLYLNQRSQHKNTSNSWERQVGTLPTSEEMQRLAQQPVCHLHSTCPLAHALRAARFLSGHTDTH